MIVCLCEGVSDGEIKRAINDGARTLECVGRRCGAGTECGGCCEVVRRLLVEHSPARAASSKSTTQAAGTSVHLAP